MSVPPLPLPPPSPNPAVPFEDPDRTMAGEPSGAINRDLEPVPTMKQSPDAKPDAAEQWPRVPGYQILGVLGRGGMGVVYKARQVGLGRYVALKMILGGGHASPEDMVRFLAEGEAVAQLQHSNIVQIYQVGRHGELPFFSLEFVDGGSLAQQLDGRPQPPRDAACLVASLAHGMHVAHQKGIVHRDLKPSNILLARAGMTDSGEKTPLPVRSLLAACTPKITDFGLAKRIASSVGLTQTGAILGTPSYMAPEQAEARKNVGPAADIYSLGAVLYEMLTGRPPFLAPTQLETVLQVLSNEPVPPARLQPGCPRDLETICLKCLQKDSARRYASAEALADDLQRFLTDRPILARRIGSFERLRRWCRRNPLVASMTAAVILLLVLLATGSLLAAVWLYEARQATLDHLGRAESAERQRTEQLATSYLEQARARRFSRQVGQRFQSLKALTEAARIIRGMDLDDERRRERLDELREEAVACLVLPDLRPARRLEDVFIENHGTGFQQAVVFAPRWDVYARADSGGPISIRRLDDDREIHRLPGSGPTAYILAFSPDGRYLAAKYYRREKPVEYLVWDWQSGREVLRQACAPPISPVIDFAFTADSRHILLGCRADALLTRYDLATGKEEARLNTGPPQPQVIALHPDGRRLATAHGNEVTLRDADTGVAVGPPWHLPGNVWSLAWQKEGNLLAVGGVAEGRIHLWDASSRQERGILEGHESTVVKLAFNAQGTLLASYSWDRTSRLWDPLSGKELLNLPSEFSEFSPDGRHLVYVKGKELGIWELADTDVCRMMIHPEAIARVDFHADGVMLVSATRDDTYLWDARSKRQLAQLRFGPTAMAGFHAGGDLLTFSQQRGLWRWPLQRLEPDRLTLGPPRALRLPPNAIAESGCLAAGGDDLALVAASRVMVLDLDEETPPRVLGEHPRARYVHRSPDGRWVATATFKGRDVKVWDLRAAPAGKEAATLPGGDRTFVRFSQDGRWLVVNEYVRMVRYFYRVGTWEMERQETITPGDEGLASTVDGRMMAAPAQGARVIRLFDPATGRNWATLPALRGQRPFVCCFNRDGSRLAASNGRILQLWDLRALRAQLAEMDLDWQTHPYPALPESSAEKPLDLRVQGAAGDNVPSPPLVVLPPSWARPDVRPEQLAVWIRHLDAADPKVRQTAEDALATAGPSAVKALSAIAEGPTSAKRKQVRALLDRIAVGQALTPARMRLRFQDVSLAEALRTFREQSGIAVSYQPPGFGPPPRRLNLQLDDVSAWEALDRICDAAGAYLDTSNLSNLSVSLRSPPPSVRGYAGPFRVQSTGGTYSRSSGTGGTNERMQLRLLLLHEPRARGLGVSSVRLTEARGTEGQSLLLGDAGTWTQGTIEASGLSYLNLVLPLKAMDRRGAKINVLKGVLSLEVMMRPRQRLIVPDLAKAPGHVFYGAEGHRLTVLQGRRTATRWDVLLSVAGPPNWNYDPQHCRFEFVDVQGHALPARNTLRGPFPLRSLQPEDLACFAAAPLAPSLLALPWTAFAAQARRPTAGQWQGTLGVSSSESFKMPVHLRMFDCDVLRTELPFELRDVPLP